MIDALTRLQKITSPCDLEMHEPDNQDIRALVHGNHLDNAMGDNPAWNGNEFTVEINDAVTGKTEYFNLATLIALARRAQ